MSEPTLQHTRTLVVCLFLLPCVWSPVSILAMECSSGDRETAAMVAETMKDVVRRGMGPEEVMAALDVNPRFQPIGEDGSYKGHVLRSEGGREVGRILVLFSDGAAVAAGFVTPPTDPRSLGSELLPCFGNGLAERFDPIADNRFDLGDGCLADVSVWNSQLWLHVKKELVLHDKKWIGLGWGSGPEHGPARP